MMGADAAIGRAERHPAGQAMGDEHAVEGVARPVEPEPMTIGINRPGGPAGASRPAPAGHGVEV